MSNLLFSPHADDEALFAAFTLCREAADIQVVVIFDGHVQASRGEPFTWLQRRNETVAALIELGVKKKPIFAGFSDAAPDWEGIIRFVQTLSVPGTVYVPLPEPNGHMQHNFIGRLFDASGNAVWHGAGVSTTFYSTYTSAGKSIGITPVIPEPDHVIRKLRALACYRSQITVENCREHFMRGLHEYYA